MMGDKQVYMMTQKSRYDVSLLRGHFTLDTFNVHPQKKRGKKPQNLHNLKWPQRIYPIEGEKYSSFFSKWRLPNCQLSKALCDG